MACDDNIFTEFGFAHPRCKAKMLKHMVLVLLLLSVGSIWSRLSIFVYNMEYCHENYI